MTKDTSHADWTAIEAGACREPSLPFTPEQEARVVELIAAAQRVKADTLLGFVTSALTTYRDQAFNPPLKGSGMTTSTNAIVRDRVGGGAAALRVECLKLATMTDVAEFEQIVRLAGQFEEFCLAGQRSEDRLTCLSLAALQEVECIIERAGALAAFVEAGCQRDG